MPIKQFASAALNLEHFCTHIPCTETSLESVAEALTYAFISSCNGVLFGLINGVLDRSLGSTPTPILKHLKWHPVKFCITRIASPINLSVPWPHRTYRTSSTNKPHQGTYRLRTWVSSPSPARAVKPLGTELSVWRPLPSGTLSPCASSGFF